MELPSFDLYVGSLYWAVMTVSTIGYGDVLPSTSLERVFVILAMLTGAFAYGYIIGAVSGIVATRDAKKNAFYSTMDGLNNFMELSKLPQTLRIKLREYFTYRCNNSVDVQGYNQLMQVRRQRPVPPRMPSRRSASPLPLTILPVLHKFGSGRHC